MGGYRELQKELDQQLTGLASMPALQGPKIDRLVDKLRQNRFNLVVLGAFKRGKSTLINALLGKPVLPTAIVPLTSVVTILTYGEELGIEVLFTNGERREIPPEGLVDYITEKGNPRNKKGVHEVKISYPSPYLRDGVRIIDTPGVGSVYEHNTDVALNFLPRVDAGVFVVTVDPPLSAAEHEFLKDIREYVHKLFFVLNKIDYVAEAEHKEALEFTSQVLQADLATDRLMIFPISAKMALEGKQNGSCDALECSLLPQFEKHLSEFLYKEKGQVLLISILNGALKAITDSTLTLKVERQASTMSLKELEEKTARFDGELKVLEKEREFSLLLLDGRMKDMVKELDVDVQAFKRTATATLRREVEAEFHKKSHSAIDLRGEMEQFLFGALRTMFNLWRRQEIDKLTQKLSAIHEEFAGRINGILERLTELTARIFDFSLRGVKAEEVFTERSEFWFKFKEDPVGLELLQMGVTSLLPRALTKGLLLRKLLESVAQLVDQHCGRVRYDLERRLEEIVKEFRRTWLAKVDDTTQSIRQALERAKAQKQTSAQATTIRLGDLDQKLTEILQAEAGLLTLKERIVALQ
jgi:small GTP-binding protein